MYRKFVGFVYWMHLIVQSLFCLVTPLALLTGAGYLLVRFAGVGEWIYAPLILIGALTGFVSMIRFILTVSENIRRLEDERDGNVRDGSDGSSEKGTDRTDEKE